MKYIYLSALTLFAAYILVLIFIYTNQRNLLYHPKENNYAGDTIKFDYKEVFIEVEQDIKIKSWFIEKNLKLKSWFVKKDLKKFKTLIFFHGNAGNLLNRVHKINKLNNLNLNILIISWRSFSGNLGSPTEINLYNDARKGIDWLNKQGVKKENIILYGESLGTGVAVQLAQEDTFNSIILESPYTSMEKAAKIYYPYLPVKLLLKDKFDSIKKIKNVKIPILIMHGAQDSIIPFEMGVEIFEKANEPKYSYFSQDDNHMMDFNEELIKKIKSFIYLN